MTRAPVLSIVIPVYNEGGHIADSLGEIRGQAQSLSVPFELIVIDDGSTDNTWAELTRLVETMPELRSTALARNFGKEAAIHAGLSMAVGKAAIVMDGDLQHPPALIGDMFRLWLTGDYKVVNAVKRQRGDESPLVAITAKLFYRLIDALADVRLRGSSDFKLLDREVIDAYCRLAERNTFFRAIVSWMGYHQIDVPFDVQPRAAGQSKWSALHLARFALTNMVSFTNSPLQLVTGAGLLFLAFAIALAGHTVYAKLSGGAVEGFSTVILIVLIASAIMMLSLGILGEYLAMVYDEIKGRPRYLVRSELKAAKPRKALPSPAPMPDAAPVKEEAAMQRKSGGR